MIRASDFYEVKMPESILDSFHSLGSKTFRRNFLVCRASLWTC